MSSWSSRLVDLAFAHPQQTVALGQIAWDRLSGSLGTAPPPPGAQPVDSQPLAHPDWKAQLPYLSLAAFGGFLLAAWLLANRSSTNENKD